MDLKQAWVLAHDFIYEPKKISVQLCPLREPGSSNIPTAMSNYLGFEIPSPLK